MENEKFLKSAEAFSMLEKKAREGENPKIPRGFSEHISNACFAVAQILRARQRLPRLRMENSLDAEFIEDNELAIAANVLNSYVYSSRRKYSSYVYRALASACKTYHLLKNEGFLD